jgi:DNA-binding response OmpR family regulator
MARLLIVENNQNLAENLEREFQLEGYDVIVYFSGKTALEALVSFSPDCVILDSLVSASNTLDICRAIRQISITPIIITTDKASEVDKILAFELGADNYLVKPFTFNQLNAFVKALIRRTEMVKRELAPKPATKLFFADLSIDLETQRVALADKPLNLSRREYELLAFLVQHYGKTFTREELRQQIWKSPKYDITIVDTKISALRNKLLDDSNYPRFIHTIYGIGYRFSFAFENNRTQTSDNLTP